MADLQVTNIFADGDTVSATNFNTNYSDIVTYINNRNSAAATWDSLYSSSSVNVPLTANNSSGTVNVAEFRDNGDSVFTIYDGGVVSIPLQDYVRASGGSQIFNTSPAKFALSVVSQTHSSFDGSNDRFTCVHGGKYFITALVSCLGAVSGATIAFNVYIYKNGSSFSFKANRVKGSPLVSNHASAFDVVSLSAGDYIEVYGATASSQVAATGTTIFISKLS